jgi:hypothetical protein
MKRLQKFTISAPLLALVLFCCMGVDDCEPQHSSDTIQQAQQERILQEGTSAVGMPAIKNFREKREMKEILEMRDQEGLVTYTYTFSEQTGKFTFFCNSIGYPIPYATQFTNPQKISVERTQYGLVIPQADPNGLFSPASADGTWVLCTHGKKAGVVYVEPKVTTLPFPLPGAIGGPTE